MRMRMRMTRRTTVWWMMTMNQIKMTTTTISKDFDHPCKNTCSGWSQGRARGRLEMEAALKIANDKLATAQNHVRILENKCDELEAANERFKNKTAQATV